MSRGGYRKLERQMMQEELEKMKEAAESDPRVVIQAPAPPPRHKKWKAERIKAGKYINPAVTEVAARIVGSDGDRVISRGSDLCAMEKGRGVLQVKHIPLELVGHSVYEDELVCDILSEDGLGDGHADVAGADDGDLGVSLGGRGRSSVKNGLEEGLR